jgi:hypothetical protein
MHIPKNTYPERILTKLQPIYMENANIINKEIRETKLLMIQFAIQYLRDHYTPDSEESLRLRVYSNGEVEMKKEPVSNIRIFFE